MIKIKLDKRNTNLHTNAGLQLLDKSIDKVGIIESYTISNDGVVISGNARHEKISAKITKEPIVIETDGTEAIIIKRTDIESNTKKFHEASILANTTAHKNYNPDNELIEEIAVEYDIDIVEVGVEVVDKVSDSDQNDLSDTIKNLYRIEIICKDEEHQENTYNKLIEQGHECRLLTL